MNEWLRLAVLSPTLHPDVDANEKLQQMVRDRGIEIDLSRVGVMEYEAESSSSSSKEDDEGR
jgi:hypothetical protein